MIHRSSRGIHDARLHEVLQYIDEHIAEELDLHALAAVAALSPHHFHRLFAAWTGERLGEFRRRRRLEIAAMRLAAQPALSVMDVALGVGFGSSEAFARAFKAHFGRSPSVWRQDASASTRHRNVDQANRNPGQARRLDIQQHDGSAHFTSEPPMNVRLESLQPVTIAYLRHWGPYGAPVNQFWQETVFPWMRANSLVGAPRYGISHDDPSITVPARCRYDACVEVPADTVLTGQAMRTTLPGGRYAVTDYAGAAADIGEAWSALLREWLPASGLQLDGRPAFEYYPRDAACDPQTGALTCEICVPVAPL